MGTKQVEKKNVMTEELAITEIYDFLKLYIRKPCEIDKVPDEYPNILMSVMDGTLVFKDGVPEYTLIHPIPEKTVIQFKTRIDPVTKNGLLKGIDVKNNIARYKLVLVAHVAGFATVAELKDLHKFDYEVIEELTTVFS